MEKFNKLSLPAVIIIASIILGGFIMQAKLANKSLLKNNNKLR